MFRCAAFKLLFSNRILPNRFVYSKQLLLKEKQRFSILLF